MAGLEATEVLEACDCRIGETGREGATEVLEAHDCRIGETGRGGATLPATDRFCVDDDDC